MHTTFLTEGLSKA